MPQKRNPVGSTLARASARLAAAHAAVLVGSLEQEHERAAGAWQAEWEALAGALAHTGGALHALAGALESLEVDAARMRRNLDLTGGLVLAERVAFLLQDRLGRAEAQEVVREAAAAEASFRDALLADPRAGLDAAELDAALDPVDLPRLGGRARRPRARVLRELAAADRGRCVTLHYRLDGPHGAPPLMLCNSLGTTLEMWDPQVPALRRSFRLVRYDRRGHGRSPVPPGPYSIEDLGRDALDLLDDLGIERASFCGLSIGGMVGHVARLGGAGADRPARPLLHRTEPAAARAVAGTRGDGASGRSRGDR